METAAVTPFVQLREVAAERTPLLPPLDVDLQDISVYSNAEQGSRMAHPPAFAARTAHLEGIELVRLLPGAVMSGPADYAVFTGDQPLREQLAPWFRADSLALKQALERTVRTEEIDQHVVVIARYGEGTWGHWLDELLPKLVLVENLYPARFHYAVPYAVVYPQPHQLAFRRMSETLRAYGIPAERLVGIRRDRRYTFRNLHAVTPVWSDRIIHPGCVQLMQDCILVPPTSRQDFDRVALFRGDNNRRQISNDLEVRECLKDRGLRTLEIALLPFAEQVALFRNARLIFTILGSTLAGSIYSGEELGVVACTPDNFSDDFFYGILRLKRGRYAEVRGPLDSGTSVYKQSSFQVPVAALDAALRAVESAYAP